MDAVLQAIVEPRRRAILRLVRDRELTAGGIAAHFEVSRPAISQHLKVLREAGLVSERRDGTRRLFRMRPEGFVELRRELETMWDASNGLEAPMSDMVELFVPAPDGTIWADCSGGRLLLADPGDWHWRSALPTSTDLLVQSLSFLRE